MGVAPHTHARTHAHTQKAFACVSHQVHNVVFIGNNMSEGFNANILLPSMASAENQYTCILL